VFICNAKTCKAKGRFGRNVRRYLDTGDSQSTSNLRRHAKGCWGEEAIKAADRAEDADAARMVLGDRGTQNGTITSAFERVEKQQQHIPIVNLRRRKYGMTHLNLISLLITRDRAEIVRWVSESMRPFIIVEDRGFRKLIKTGRPYHYIPSKEIVSRDVNMCLPYVVSTLQKCCRSTKVHLALQRMPGHPLTKRLMSP